MLIEHRDTISASGPIDRVVADDLARSTRFDCVPLILRIMEQKRWGLRMLADSTGIGRSRLGLLLHSAPGKRQIMTLVEYHLILAALAIDPIEAVIRMPLEPAERYQSPRYQNLIAMLCEIYHGLASSLIDALEEIDDVDGSEVRIEWATAIRKAVVKRVVHEASAVAARRAALEDFSLFT